MRQIGNPLFSNPVKDSRLRVSVRPKLMGRHVGALPLFDNYIYCFQLKLSGFTACSDCC